jgi:hypothetical protein
MRKKRIRHSREQIVGHMQNQRTTSHTLAPLARRGDEVGGLLALLLFADGGLVLEVDEAIAPAFRVREWPSVRCPARLRLW